jgi:excisionase family DNA binding protein
MTESDAFLSVAQAARGLNVCPETIRRMARRGEIEHKKVGRVYRFPPAILSTSQPDTKTIKDQDTARSK